MAPDFCSSDASLLSPERLRTGQGYEFLRAASQTAFRTIIPLILEGSNLDQVHAVPAHERQALRTHGFETMLSLSYWRTRASQHAEVHRLRSHLRPGSEDKGLNTGANLLPPVQAAVGKMQIWSDRSPSPHREVLSRAREAMVGALCGTHRASSHRLTLHFMTNGLTKWVATTVGPQGVRTAMVLDCWYDP